MGPDTARRAQISRRHPGPGARLRRDDQALGQALPDGRSADGPHRRALGSLGQGDPLPPEKAVRAAARCAGRALLLDHAGAAGENRPPSSRSRKRSARDRSSSSPSERVPGQRVVFEKNPDYVPARERQAELHRRPQDRLCRPRGVEFRARSRHRLGGARPGRGRLVGEPDDRPGPATEAQQEPGHHGQGPHRRDRLPAVQPAVPAVRQCRGAPRRAVGDGPEGGHDRGRRAPSRA